jgi:hypothetical protein
VGLFIICFPCWIQSRIWVHNCGHCGRVVGKGKPTDCSCCTASD